jgi:hypothetical protein
MNPLTSQKNNKCTLPNLIVLILIVFSTFSLCSCQSPVPVAYEPTRTSPASMYGFELSGFTPAQEAVVLDTLAAYARALGGPAALREIILIYNSGQLRPITYDPNFTGALSDIRLSPTVFSMEKAASANYSCYAAASEDAHAQIVIGHEIAHILVKAAADRTGTDWVLAYEQHVSRDWTALVDPMAPREEAVTQLSLKVLGAGYYFSLNPDEPETDAQIADEIDAWVVDFLTTLKEL